jgi:hypothetical protein
MIESHWLPWFDVVEEDIDLGQSECSKISPLLFSRPVLMLLRVGRVSVVIHWLVHLSWARTSYIARDRYSDDSISLHL